MVGAVRYTLIVAAVYFGVSTLLGGAHEPGLVVGMLVASFFGYIAGAR